MTTAINERVDIVEKRIDDLQAELISCGLTKDRRIDAMHEDMTGLKDTVNSLTDEIRCAVQSLKQIALNTSTMHEVVQMYEKWKGFTWVMRNVGFWGAIILAFVAGIVVAFMKAGHI